MTGLLRRLCCRLRVGLGAWSGRGMGRTLSSVIGVNVLLGGFVGAIYLDRLAKIPREPR
jgi:hypothetical protein